MIYAISGNHDEWYRDQVNANVVEELASQLPNMEFIGHDEGELEIAGVKIMLAHGNDATTSYATSYRVQKKVESLTSGQKPNILLMGHSHKHGYFFERNIHCFQTGCMQDQSAWMRSKRLAAHLGFWIVEMKHRDGEVVSLKCQWNPFYV